MRGEERIMPGEGNYAWGETMPGEERYAGGGGKLCLGRKDMLGEEVRCRVYIILIMQY